MWALIFLWTRFFRLVSIMKERDDPLPGLLYQADVGNRPLPTPSPPRASSITRLPAASSSPSLAQPSVPGIVGMESNIPGSFHRDTLDPERGRTSPRVENDSSLHPLEPSNQPSIVETDIRHNLNAAAGHPLPDHEYEDGYDEDDDHTIKLGLGDFVFYSILAAKSALVSFTTFVVVFLVIQVGLALTMLLLAMYKQALPALPLSIFLGLFFFFVTDLVLVPFVAFNNVRLQVI